MGSRETNLVLFRPKESKLKSDKMPTKRSPRGLKRKIKEEKENLDIDIKNEAFITADENEQTDDNETANEKIDQVLEVMKQYRKDYEQDFKPWTDRSEAPETNETLENLIKNMTGNVLQINQNLENNSKLRQSTIAITEVLKNL